MKVVELPISNLADVAGMFRKLAEDIEAGEYPGTDVAVVVLAPTEGPVQVFGFGKQCRGEMAHLLLAMAQRRIENGVMDHWNE